MISRLWLETMFPGMRIRTPQEEARVIVPMGTYPVEKVCGAQMPAASSTTHEHT